MKAKTKNKSFVKGAIILMIFGIISKVIGAVYRLPLTSIVTAEGMGLYQLVFPVYTIMLTISSGGLPSSISKLISENLAKKQFRQANKILKLSFVLLVSFSFLCALVIAFCANFFANIQGNQSAYVCYYGIAPAVVFVALISGFRGFFQGCENMYPSAISGLIEQSVKLIAGLFLAQKFLSKGVAYAVLGAMLGITLSEIVAFFYLLISFVMHKIKNKVSYNSQGLVLSNKSTFKAIISTSAIITIGGLIMPFGMLIDSSLIINLLKGAGYSSGYATTLFGLQSGTVGSIINMPVVLSLALATAILPRVSVKNACKDKVGLEEDANKAVLFAVLLALPASFGCLGLADPILKLLYRKSLTADQINMAANILQVASISIFYLAVLQVTSGILQGIGKAWVPLVSLSVGVIVKIVLNVLLVPVDSIGILGAEIASASCYFAALLINLIVLKKQGVIKLNFKLLILMLFAVATYAGKYVFELIVKTNVNFYLSFFTSIFVVVLLYSVVVFILYRKEIFKRKT